MTSVQLQKLLHPATVVELDGEPAVLLTFTRHLIENRAVTLIAAGRLSRREASALNRFQSGYRHASSSLAAARWSLATALACEADTDVLVVLLASSRGDADEVLFTQWLEETARKTNKPLLLLRSRAARRLPSPARWRYVVTTDDFFLTTEFQLTDVRAGLPLQAPLPVAEFVRPPTLPSCLESVAAALVRVCRRLRGGTRGSTALSPSS